MGHNRKLVLSGVALTKARNNRHDIEVMGEVMDEMEQVMLSTGYLENAPFRWIGLTLRYGLKNDDKPQYGRVDKRDGELPVAIELDTHELRNADREELKQLFTIAVLKTLIHIGEKYKLSTAEFVGHRDKLLSARG